MVNADDVKSAAAGVSSGQSADAELAREEFRLLVAGLENARGGAGQRADAGCTVVGVATDSHKEKIIGVGIGVDRRGEITGAAGGLADGVGVVIMTEHRGECQ